MKEKELWVAYLLWLFFGLLGVHKFYLEKWVMGLLYFFTCGFFFIGWFIDLFTLPSQVERYNLRTHLSYSDYRNQYTEQQRMDQVIRKARGMERRLRNVEDIITSEEYNFHRKLNHA